MADIPVWVEGIAVDSDFITTPSVRVTRGMSERCPACGRHVHGAVKLIGESFVLVCPRCGCEYPPPDRSEQVVR